MHQALTADAPLPLAAPSIADPEAVDAAASEREPAEPAPAESARDSRDDVSSARDPLGPYFRDIASFDVMGREAELEAATRIVHLRRSFWRNALAYPPFIEGICDLLPQLLSELPAEPVAEMKRAARALRDRDLVVNQTAYEAAREQLTAVLTELDLAGNASDRIVADLLSIESGANESLGLKVKLPPRGSGPFLAYLASVRAEHHALATARSAFLTANLRLVVSIARRFGTLRMPLQDLIQEGNLGLIKAIERFDHRRGFRFSTYASWWIRHAIGRAIAEKGRAVRLPVHMLEAYNKVRKARREYEAQHGEPPTDAVLAQITGVSVERLDRMHTALLDNPVSLDQPVGGGNSDGPGLSLADALTDPDAELPADLLDQAHLLSQLRESLAALPAMEADILRKRMGLDDEEALTLKEIGDQYSLSRERIRQLQEVALNHLRAEFRRRALL
jgi:RNA polymerase primary sigma factor